MQRNFRRRAGYFAARLWLLPEAMAAIPVRPLTWTGVLLDVVVPSPSWPRLLFPQVHQVFFNAAGV